MNQVVDLQEVRPGVWRDEAKGNGAMSIIKQMLGGRKPLRDEFGDSWPYSAAEIKKMMPYFRGRKRQPKILEAAIQAAQPSVSEPAKKALPGSLSQARI